MNINDRARIVGNDYSGHGFEIGDTVILIGIDGYGSHEFRLEGGTAEYFVHPGDFALLVQDEALEKEVAVLKHRVALLNRVLDYALGSVTDRESARIQGFWDAMEEQS